MKPIVVVLLLMGVSASAVTAQPNLIFLFSDDAGYADFGFQDALSGTTTEFLTPNLDQMAQSGVQCSQAYVTCSVCSPSRAGLLSGRYQNRFGYEYNIANADNTIDGMPLTEKLLFERIGELGYQVGAIGKWHIGREWAKQPKQRGVDYFYGLWGGSRPYFGIQTDPVHKIRDVDGNHRAWTTLPSYNDIPNDPTYGRHLTDAFGDAACEFITDNATNGTPFCLYVPFTSPHGPYDKSKAADYALFSSSTTLTENGKNSAGLIYAMDRAIGNILSCLDDHNIATNTIVFFTNDNGGPNKSGAHRNTPLRGYKSQAYEGGFRVPFIARIPDPNNPGQFYTGLYTNMVSTLDIYPTFVEAAGGTVEKQTDGVNLIPYLSGQNTNAPHEQLIWRKGSKFAFREGMWKLLKQANGIQLMELQPNGTGEWTDQSSAYPNIRQDLIEKYVAWEVLMQKPRTSTDIAYNHRPNTFDDFRFNHNTGSFINWSDTDVWKNAVTGDAATMISEDSFANLSIEFQPKNTGAAPVSTEVWRDDFSTSTSVTSPAYGILIGDGNPATGEYGQWVCGTVGMTNGQMIVKDHDLSSKPRAGVIVLNGSSIAPGTYSLTWDYSLPGGADMDVQIWDVQANTGTYNVKHADGGLQMNQVTLTGDAAATQLGYYEFNWGGGGTTNGTVSLSFTYDGIGDIGLQFGVSSHLDGYRPELAIDNVEIVAESISTDSYTANNDLTRQVGMDFMLNEIKFASTFDGTADQSATLIGNPLMFVNDLEGTSPAIRLDSTTTSAFDFTFNIDNNLILYDDLNITGDSPLTYIINGDISAFKGARSITKTGIAKIVLNGNNSYGGATLIQGGTLQLGNSLQTAQLQVESGAALEMNIDDLVTVDGTAILDGALIVNTGTSTNTTLVQAASISGTFWSTSLPPPPSGKNWQLVYSPTSVVLRTTTGAADTDGDELPDSWEMTHFGDLISSRGGSDDFDGDRTLDRTEFRLGLNPTDPDSAFTIQYLLWEDYFFLSWPSLPETVFAIETLSESNQWQESQGNIDAASPGTNTTWTTPLLKSSDLFRVRLD